MMADNPTVKLLFLTLTVKNCAIADLRANLKAMSEAFKKLMMRRSVERVVVGYARGMEITRSKKDEAHPHFHVLLAVKSGYFGGTHYITQDAWSIMWQESLGVEYKPIVDIRKVKPKKNSLTEIQTIMDAVRETAKYMTKAEDLVGGAKESDADWLNELTDQLHGTKQMNLGGIFRKYVKTVEPSPEEILLAEQDDQEEELSGNELISFNWYGSLGKYARKVSRESME
jgi:plasmid rolling circle replication initiator protein Rep